MFSRFEGPICCKNLTSTWYKAYICKTTEAEFFRVISMHDMMNILIKCQIL